MERSLLKQQQVDSLSEQELHAIRLPSYQPTAWPFVNRVLDIVDTVTGGRAGWCQRFFTYAFIGGCAAVVNMAVFYLVFNVVAVSLHETIRNVIASAIAAEISIIVNFLPNDYVTFRHLSGHQRSWMARCLRFHITAMSGIVLIFLIQFAVSHLLHIQPIIGQAIALIIVFFYNFSFHHIFTYRRVKSASGQI